MLQNNMQDIKNNKSKKFIYKNIKECQGKTGKLNITY